jgi:hypothetical protein
VGLAEDGENQRICCEDSRQAHLVRIGVGSNPLEQLLRDVRVVALVPLERNVEKAQAQGDEEQHQKSEGEGGPGLARRCARRLCR